MTNHRVNTIDTHELKKRRDNNPKICLIDVRELHEWNNFHIPGALHIPKDELASCLEAKFPDQNQPLYLYCKGGMRSLYAANYLSQAGYKEVYSVDGGVDEWARHGYPVE